MSIDALVKAASNNASWCDAVCQTHGISGDFSDSMWTSKVRTPLLYPDAVTLQPAIDVEAMLAEIDTSTGCTIKDSFSSCDMRAHGFTILFEASWLLFPRQRSIESDASGGSSDWSRVTKPADFREWVNAWRGESGPTDVLRERLLGHPDVTIMAKRDADEIVSGLILFADGDVVSVSNAFHRGNDEATWLDDMDQLGIEADVPVVGYESGDDLVAVLRSGATELGPLRIWTKNH